MTDGPEDEEADLTQLARGIAEADAHATRPREKRLQTQMIAFLGEHPHLYTWSGIAFVVLAVALVVAVLAVREIVTAAPDAVGPRAAAVLGLFAAAFFFGQSVLRVQSPGTLMHMAGLGRE